MKLLNNNILIVGAGISGCAAAKLLLNHGSFVTLYDDKNPAMLNIDPLILNHKNLSLISARDGFEINSSLSCAVISPGVPLQHDIVQRLIKHDIPIYNEIEIALSFIKPQKIIGITGTNGKSTTTVMMDSILKAAGLKTVACGNLGTPLCEVAQNSIEYDYCVIELSSFQLDVLQNIELDGAIVVNITPDHLDRYKSFADYRNAKLKIISLLNKNGVLAINESCAPNITYKNCHIFSAKLFAKDQLAFLQDAHILGQHNQENAVAAATLALALGITKSAIIEGLNSFQALPHRCEIVDEKQAITFVNDSKGTTVVAVQKALSMFDRPVHLLLGGIEKGENFGQLAPRYFPHIKGYYVFGQAQEKIMAELNNHRAYRFDNMEQSFKAATAQACPGDIILLSPGCASYDQFENYQHRGQVFRQLVEAINKA